MFNRSKESKVVYVLEIRNKGDVDWVAQSKPSGNSPSAKGSGVSYDRVRKVFRREYTLQFGGNGSTSLVPKKLA